MHNQKFRLFLLTFCFCVLILLPAFSRPAKGWDCANYSICPTTGWWLWGGSIYEETGITCYLHLGTGCSGPVIDACSGSGYNCQSTAYLYYGNYYSIECNEDIYDYGRSYLGP